MRERVVQFGAGASLTGVLTEPGGQPAGGAGLPTVLLLNSGVLHRVGACRLHVKLARALAERGLSSLRFDFSGIGDSQARKDTLPFEKSSVLDVQAAMDHLQAQRGARTFVLVGLCSGADAAFFTALEEPRVVGLVQMDAFCYRTPLWYVNHYGPRLLEFDTWRRALEHPRETLRLLLRPGGKLADRASRGTAEPEADAPEYVRVFPPQRWWQDGLRRLASRGVRQHFIYTNGVADHYNYAGQFMDSNRGIDFRDTVKLLFLPKCDHLITERAHQQQVVESIRHWATTGWAVEPAPELQQPSPARAAG